MNNILDLKEENKTIIDNIIFKMSVKISKITESFFALKSIDEYSNEIELSVLPLNLKITDKDIVDIIKNCFSDRTYFVEIDNVDYGIKFHHPSIFEDDEKDGKAFRVKTIISYNNKEELY